MKKLFILLLSVFVISNLWQGFVYSADQWDKGDPAGTESPSDIDTLVITNNGVLDRLLSDYREGARITYLSASAVSVSAGQVACDNNGRTLRRWRETTAANTYSLSSNLDSESTWLPSRGYYVYAVADTDATTFTATISLHAESPSGTTYYRRLGNFTTDGSGNIDEDTVTNDGETFKKVFMAKGTIAHGGTIPLPTGVDAAHCYWMVSMSNTTEVDSWGLNHITCSADSSRVVTCRSLTVNPEAWVSGTANYIIIGYDWQ